MRAVVNLAMKDLLLLWRDKAGLFWVAGFPLLMALFFGSIFSGGGRTGAMSIAVIDDDRSENSRLFTEELKKSDALNVVPLPIDSAKDLVRQGNLTAYVLVKKGFGENTFFVRDTSGGIEVGIDPSRKAEAGYLEGLITQASFVPLQRTFTDPRKAREMIAKSRSDISDEDIARSPELTHLMSMFSSLDRFIARSDTTALAANSPMRGPAIEVVEIARVGDRPKTSWEITFPQSMIWALIGCAAAFAVSIVVERTRGTFLRLRLAPVSRMHILLGKGLACFLACASVMTALLVFGIAVFGVRVGNPLHLLVAVVASALCFVGIMMTISVLGKTENSVSGSGWGILLIFSMIGGGMIPLLMMPEWMVKVSHFSPVKWSILAAEGAIWRGFTPDEMLLPVAMLLAAGTIGFSIGVVVLSRGDE